MAPLHMSAEYAHQLIRQYCSDEIEFVDLLDIQAKARKIVTFIQALDTSGMSSETFTRLEVFLNESVYLLQAIDPFIEMATILDFDPPT